MIRLDAPSRVVRAVGLAASARSLLPGEELELAWPLGAGVPWRRRLAAIAHEARILARDGGAPGAFNDEILARDAERAGLRLVRRHGDVITLRREAGLSVQARDRLSMADARATVSLVLQAELLLRVHASPDRLIASARRVGARSASPRSRAELRADVALLEPLVPGRRGCLRRLLAEIVGHPEAAREPVVLGLTPHATGHASFAHTTPWAPEHPVSFVIPSGSPAPAPSRA